MPPSEYPDTSLSGLDSAAPRCAACGFVVADAGYIGTSRICYCNANGAGTVWPRSLSMQQDGDLERTNELLTQLLEEIKALRQSPSFVPSILSLEAARVPPGGVLALSVSPDMLDCDFVRLHTEMREYFGDISERILIFRAGDAKLGVIAFEEGNDDEGVPHAA